MSDFELRNNESSYKRNGKMQKKKVCLVISSELYVRNYCETGAFRELEEAYECFYLVPKRLENQAKDWGRFITYEMRPEEEKQHYDFFNVLMWKNRKKSKSFAFRVKRVFGLNFRIPSEFGKFRKAKRAAGILLKWLYKRLLFITVSTEPIYSLYLRYKTKKFGKNKDIVLAFKNEKPDLVVFPCSAHDPVGDEIVLISKAGKAKTLFLVDNWDNLSSKTVLFFQPDYLGVWGEQAVAHAENIQGIPGNRVVPIGTPRYESYFQLRDNPPPSHFDFNYILFVGTSLPFNEFDALDELERVITNNQNIFGDLKIVYRPHPWRLSQDIFDEGRYNRVVIDPQVRDAFLRRESSATFQPNLDYYPGLLANAELVVGGLTSMMIETLIFRKKYIALVYDDGKNLTSQHNVLANYIHFEGIEKSPEIILVKEFENLKDIVIKGFQEKNLGDCKAIDGFRGYYLFHDENQYGERLMALCNLAINKNEHLTKLEGADE